MSLENRQEIVGKSFKEVAEVNDLFVGKYLRSFPPDDEHPVSSTAIGLSNYNRGQAHWIIHVYILQEPTSELLKSLSLPKTSFKKVPIKYRLTGEFIAGGSRNQLFE